MSYEPPKNGFRTFLIVWATQSVSVVGSALTLFAVNIWLAATLYPLPEQKAKLAAALALLNLAFAIPTLLAAPLAGAWADRHDRKRTMFVNDLLSGCLSLALAVLMATHRLQMWSLILLAIAFALTGVFHGAAFDSSYAMLVPDAQLPRANGMMQSMWALSNILSPAIAAFFIAIPVYARQGHLSGSLGATLAALSDGAPLAIGVDAVTFLLAASVLPFLHVPSPRRTGTGEAPERSIWADIRVGAEYIWRRRPMLWLLGTFAVANLCTPFAVVTPLLVKFNLAGDWQAKGYTLQTALAMLNTLEAIGGLAAGALVSTWGGLKQKRVYGVIVPLLFAGAMQVLFGLSHGLFPAAVVSLLLAAAFPLANVHSQTIWQTQTPRDLQGRVFSVRRVIAQFTGPISTALTGWLTGLFDPGAVLAMFGAVAAAFCLAQLFNPYLLRVEDKGYLDRLAAGD